MAWILDEEDYIQKVWRCRMFQVQLVVIIIFLAVFDLIYRIIDKKNKSYNYSPIYLRIEKIYKKWYVKNISIVNNSRASAIKIRETIFTLVKDLRKDGIKQKDIDNYYSLITAVPKKNKWYTMVAGLVTVVGGSKLVKPISQDIIKTLKQVQIDNNFLVSILLPIFLFLVVIYLLVRFTYILLMNDNSKRNSEKNAIFKEVKTLYNVENVETDNTDLRTPLEIARDEAMAPIKLEWLSWIMKKVISWLKNKGVIRAIALIMLLCLLSLLSWLDYLTLKLCPFGWEFIILAIFLIIITIVVFILFINYICVLWKLQETVK